jgi:hypothetical protein
MLHTGRGFCVITMTLMFIFFTLESQFDATLSHAAYAQTDDAAGLIVDHFVGSVGGVGTRDARGLEAGFVQPDAIAGNSKYVFSSDSLAFTVRKIDPATADVTTAVGQPFVQDPSGRV